MDWVPVRDLTPTETHRLNVALWRMEHHVYDKRDWGYRHGASVYQGRGV